MRLYHYYDRTVGPFRNLSDLPIDQAKDILDEIRRTKPGAQSAKRHAEYVENRHYYESVLRTEFAKKGGVMEREYPHYMVVEPCPWLSTWFYDSAFVEIPIGEFDLRMVSFTYGDSHPMFSPRPRPDDWKEYRRQLYTYGEIVKIIEKYGLPQDWNADGIHGPERYVEAHIWSDTVIDRYRRQPNAEPCSLGGV